MENKAWVGITSECKLLATFIGTDAYDRAVEYIDNLKDAEKGIYYLDYQEGD